jgi:pimeloyl-ACP methyl ester carboxylesterase
MAILPVDGFITANNLQLHYRRWLPAEPQPGLPSILLLHGLASSAHIWNLVAPQLAAHGHVVTALDQRGHGESEKPSGDYDFATIIADDRVALAALSIERPVLVGHSWGAAVALQYAATYPDGVAALVLVDGATNQLSLRPGWSREQAMKDLAPPRFAGTPRETFLGFIRRGPLGAQWRPELEDIMLHIVQLRDDDTVAPRLDFENHLQIVSAMWDQPTFELYQQVQCPITLIVAEMESADPASERFRSMRREGIVRIQELNPAIHVVRMPNTIHDIPLQRPTQLAEEILQAVSQA